MKPPKFKIGDVIASSLSPAKTIIDIRIGTHEDFPVVKLANGQDFCVDWSGEMCYVLQASYGRTQNRISVYSVKSVDSDHHLRGTEMYIFYQTYFEKLLSSKDPNFKSML